jgi:uncharacterized protein (TIGR03435 family)
MLTRAILTILSIVPSFAQQKFDVASIQPANPDSPGSQIWLMPGGGIDIANVALRRMMTLAYDVRDFQISGGPGWAATERFDIIARSERLAQTVQTIPPE